MTQPQLEPQVPPAEPPVAPSLSGVEVTLAAIVLGMLASWFAAAVGAVLAPFTMFGLMPDPAGLWSTLPQWERQVDRLITELGKVAQKGWEAAARQLGVDLPFDVTDPLVQDQLQRTRNLLVRIPDEVYRMILAELDAGVAAGDTPSQLAARINRILHTTSSENWPSRAKTVAVTEVHRAYNMGAVALGQRADAADPRVLTKRWDSREDSRVRLAHAAADGQLQLVNQPFIVDGEPLMAPGDPRGMPHNVINCRCKIHFNWGTNGRQ